MKQKKAAIGLKFRPFPDVPLKATLLKNCSRIFMRLSKAVYPLMCRPLKSLERIVFWKLPYEVNFRQRIRQGA